MAVSTHQTSTDPVDPRRYACETRVVSGLGVISLLPEELRVNRISKPALVVDAGISRAGLLEKWLPSDITNLPARILCPVNPDLEIVEEGIDAAKSHQCDGVIIIGGGSAICMGKAIAIMLRNPGHILDYEGSDKLKNTLPVPVICVPTTAGSGSEVSRVLVLHEHGRRQEVIVRQSGTEPRVALLDGQVLADCPRTPFLDAALDAMTHACESLWSHNRSLITDALAEKALETFLTRLPAAINDREPSAMQAIIEASSAANLACGNTGLALCHALNTAPDVPLPHGYTNGCLVKAVAAFNRPLMEPRHQKLIDGLPKLFEEVGWTGKFKQGDCDSKNARLFVEASQGHPFRKNNLRGSSDEECYNILRASGADIAAAATA